MTLERVDHTTCGGILRSDGGYMTQFLKTECFKLFFKKSKVEPLTERETAL